MIYIKKDDDIYIEYDEIKNTAIVLSKSELQRQLDINIQQLNSFSPPLSDDQLLAWARQNYPDNDTRNREVLQPIIDDLQSKLDAINTSTDTVKSSIEVI